MNGKQSKMLRRMSASKSDLMVWRAITRKDRGRLRDSYLNCTKMIFMRFDQALKYAGLRQLLTNDSTITEDAAKALDRSR